VAKKQLILNWGVHAYGGWGVVGSNLIAQLANDPDYEVHTPYPLEHGHFMGMDALHYRSVLKAISRKYEYTDDCVWIDPVGNDLQGSKEGPKTLVGRVIVEKPDTRDAIDKLSRYTHLLTGSSWNKEILENATGREVKVIHEGIDPNLFCPGSKSGALPEAFYIYSAGKVEYRKAQDVVLLAFKRFVQKHPEARLVTLWQSPHADMANGFKGLTDAPLWLNEKGLDISRWADDNGIDPAKVIDLGVVPNYCLPPILREMDVMLAPSRCESCQSLPVMEAMACGVPVIYGYHTGMKDLAQLGHCLTRQTPIPASSEYFFPDTSLEWYESDPDEIDEILEHVHRYVRALRYADPYGNFENSDTQFLRRERTWSKHVKELKAWLSE